MLLREATFEDEDNSSSSVKSDYILAKASLGEIKLNFGGELLGEFMTDVDFLIKWLELVLILKFLGDLNLGGLLFLDKVRLWSI